MWVEGIAMTDIVTEIALINQRLNASAEERHEMLELLKTVSTLQSAASTQHALILQRLEDSGETVNGHEVRLKDLEKKDIARSAIIGAAAILGGVVVSILGAIATVFTHYFGWPKFGGQ